MPVSDGTEIRSHNACTSSGVASDPRQARTSWSEGEAGRGSEAAVVVVVEVPVLSSSPQAPARRVNARTVAPAARMAHPAR